MASFGSGMTGVEWQEEEIDRGRWMGERDASREWMEGPQRLKFPSCAAEIVSCPTTTRRAGARRSAAAITGAGGQPWLCRPVHDPRITLAYVIMEVLDGNRIRYQNGAT